MFLERVDRVIQGRVESICGFMGVVASGSCESTWTESDGGVGNIAVFCWRHREVILDQQIIDPTDRDEREERPKEDLI